jgi:hypothetical protein
MFHSIRGSLQRRQEDLSARSSAAVLVRQAVQQYIKQTYPDAVLTMAVRYDARERLVTISTPSKTLAGELTMNAGELRAHLAAQNVRVNRIVAR